MTPFTDERPDAIKVAIAILAREAGAAPLAGGTCLLDLMKQGASGRDRIAVVRRAGPPELDDAAFATLASGVNTIRMPTTKTAAMYAWAAHFAEVRVRPDVGQVRVTRMSSRIDIGRVLNPMQARSQVPGGLVFGLGMALTEQITPDFATGRVISAGITEYWLPGMGMMPVFDIGFVGGPDLIANEIGAKGAGEIGTVGSAAAIANAVFNATGRRFQALPITPDKVLPALSRTTA